MSVQAKYEFSWNDLYVAAVKAGMAIYHATEIDVTPKLYKKSRWSAPIKNTSMYDYEIMLRLRKFVEYMNPATVLGLCIPYATNLEWCIYALNHVWDTPWLNKSVYEACGFLMKRPSSGDHLPKDINPSNKPWNTLTFPDALHMKRKSSWRVHEFKMPTLQSTMKKRMWSEDTIWDAFYKLHKADFEELQAKHCNQCSTAQSTLCKVRNHLCIRKRKQFERRVIKDLLPSDVILEVLTDCIEKASNLEFCIMCISNERHVPENRTNLYCLLEEKYPVACVCRKVNCP